VSAAGNSCKGREAIIFSHREDVSTVSELGSSGVAMLVTQPAWPTRVPRIVSCSAILPNAPVTSHGKSAPRLKAAQNPQGLWEFKAFVITGW
jgi:hypothetical protein